MKKFQKLLAILLTAVMCVGTLADTGFTVFAADDVDDAVSEAQAEDGQDDAAVEEEAASDAATVEEDDPADDEPALDGGTTVNVLIVNGVDLKGKEGKALNADGSAFTGNVNDADASYMRFDNDKETRLTLHNIKLNGDCQHGIEFKGDALYVDVIGNCEIKVTGKNNSVSYGVYTYDWGNVTFRSTLDAEGKRVKGTLEIKPVTHPNAKWGGSIYCKGGNLAFETCTSDSDTKIDWMNNNERGLKVVADAGEAERSNSGGEIEGKYDVKVTDAYVQVYASGLNGYYSGIECSQKLNINSGLVITYVDAFETGSESVAVAIRAGGDIYIGEDAYVIADGEMLDTTREGRGISTPGGKITVKGKLDAASSGGDLPIYAGGNVEQTIILDGTAVNIPEEGIYDKTKKTITAYNGDAVDRVIIEKGQYYDVWVAGYRLATWNHDYLMGVDGIGEEAGFDPETGTLTFKNVNGISYRTGAAPSAPSNKYLIYTKIPLTVSGNARINYSKNIIYSQLVDLNIQGQFDFTSDEEAVLVGAAKLTIDGADTSLKVESKKEEAICCGSEGSSMVINNGVIDAKGAKAGIYCDGNIEINGGEVTAKATADSEAYAFIGLGDNREINIKEGLDIVIPEGGKVKVVKNSYNKNVTTVVDGNDNVAKEVKIAEKKYDLWLGNTQVTSTNKGDILGDGKASFDPDTWTLTLNGQMSIPGNHAVTGLGAALIYSKHALNLEGSASFNTEYNAIVIDSGYPLDESVINGDFSFKTGNRGIYSNSIVSIKGSGKTVTMDTPEECINCYVLGIYDAKVELASKNNGAIIAEVAMGLENCDLTAEGKNAAIAVFNKGENAIVLVEGLEIIEPEGGEIAAESTFTTIHDSNGNMAEKVRIAKASAKYNPSPMNPVPEGLEEVTELTLVKGQSFMMPGSGWKPVDNKVDKKYVSLSKKGKLKAKKVTESGKPAKITDGNRTIEITIVQPAFKDKKPLKLESHGTLGLISLEFSTGSDDLPVWFSSSNPDVACVYGDGTVWARTAGSTTITAYVNGKAYTKKVQVKEPEPLSTRYIHANVNVKKTLKVKGFKVAEWVVSDTDKAYFEIKKTSVKPLKTGSYVLTGLDKAGTPVCGVMLIVENPTITSAVIKETKPNSNKYQLNTDAGSIVYLTFDYMEDLVTFKSSNGEVAYADYNKDEKLVLYAQSKGKCKLTTKINGKTITINVKVD